MAYAKKPNLDASPYWFPAKRYGWGWGLPSCRQGWYVMITWTIALVLSNILLLKHPHLLLTSTFSLVISLLIICWIKGEPPRWRWGN